MTDSEGTDGTGYLTVGDLPEKALPEHFGTEPRRLTATLEGHRNGCVGIVVDGVERMPLWPDGSAVTQQPGQPDAYVVTLPDGTTVTADSAAGDTFSADGLVARDRGPFGADDAPPGKVDSFLGFCGIDAAPVAFPDAATFEPPG
jgi:hypothetical protein